MSSVQDHVPVVRELSERNQQDPQPAQPQQPQQTSQQVPPAARELDPPRPISSDGPRDYSPPRHSQYLDPLPEGAEPNPPRRGISTGTNSVTLVNHPGTIGSPTSETGAQNASVTQERSQYRPASLAPDRRQPLMYDPIRGDMNVQLSDDGSHGRGTSMRRSNLPRPMPVFTPQQDGNGNGNGSRPTSGGDSHLQQGSHPQPKTVEARIAKTLADAKREQAKYKKRATTQGAIISAAMALQVIVGAVTTGVAAGSKNIGSSVAVLGGISTGLASYLAKVRGSGEPESSKLRSRELNTFIRELEAFIMDYGTETTNPELDYFITRYRERFELILKTGAEDSLSGTGHSPYAASRYPGNFQPANQQPMPGMYGRGQYQAMPPHASGPGYEQLSEKQKMLRDEKALSGMV